MFFRFLVLFHACTAFPLQCPEPAQWSIRARGLCPDPSKYSCLKNDLIDGYSENCTISDFQAPGRKGVLRGGLDADICSQERYHPWPIKYYTNVSTNCIFVKSVCNEEGQVVYATGNRNTDITCRCDYTRGYDFIRKPRNPCYCVPSEEDCSCYLKSCIDKIYFLSADYKCIHEKMNTSTANCQTIIRESVSTERSDSSTEDTTITENIPTIVQRESYTRIIVITFCIGIILVYCIYELRGNRYCKATKPTKDSRTLIDHNTNAYDVENKAVEGFGDDKKDLALTSCFDKEIQQSQMEELEKDNDRLKIEVKRLKADRRNVPDLMMETLKQWKKEDEYFIKTRASTHVMDCIKNHPCVSVIGPSGVGKTFLVQHIALEMNKIGYTIMKVSKPEEIETNYISDRKTLFVVDDMCGNFTARKKLLHDWIMKMDNINVLLKTDFCKLILTCRLQVFRDEGFEHANLTVFQNCICNLNDNQLSLTIFEKQELAQKYFKDAYNVNMISILDLFQYDFFPFLCHYYDKNKSKANFCLKSFVRDPFALFERNISTLFVEGQGSRYKFCALLLLVLCNNQIKTKHLVGEDDKYKIILKDLQEKCRIDKQLTGEKLISELHKLTGTFLKNHEGVYQTIHDKLFDFLTHYFGTENKVTKTEFIELLIRHANYKLIEERFVIKKPDQSDDKKSKEYIITIEKREDNDQLQLYTERVFDDMTKADRYLWSNENLYYEPFKTTFITFIKELKKVNILDFIKNASSLFVRDMFAMDVNDFKNITCQCGILLDHEHLQEFVERIFRDMKKSDDIRDYIDKCRCCRNEIFRTALRTYMLQLSRDKIQDLISSASSCFLQIMFVMKERDIEHSVYSSKSFRESYGIEIHKDDIHMYLERVCHEMKKCTDVPTYISNLRCCRDQDFTTALNRFMNDPPFVRIEELKKVSISFIQRMCVLTEEDINHKSPHAFQRYGFKISCDKRKEYIERVFNDIRESINVNEHIELNRNREHLVFQTKLKSYMSQLGREQIKNLIEFASQDFIDRLCVMTIDSITDTFDFKYERYGVVIPEDCSNLYISRVFHGLKKSDDTESYVKNNRNLQTKKFKTSLRYYIKTLPDNEIKNLFQTASSDFLHKWFVTSKQDIQTDSKRNYEQYGIILHGKNLQIYNERILTLIKSDTSFRYDITCNRNITSVFEYVSQFSVSELTEVIKTASIEFFHQKIIVDVQNELEKKLSDCQSFDYVGDNILKVKEGFIRCPGSNIKQYMDRMVADWKTGNLYAVIENVNMKNQSFKQKFMDHLNRLEPFEMTKLINGTEQKTTICYSWTAYGKVNCLAIAITVCCIYCDSNLAKWCVQSHCSGNQKEKHYKMCALFMLVVFNNELTEMTLLDKAPKVMDVISSFGRNHDIHFGHDDISAELLREVLDTSMNGIVTQHNGVYSVINNLVFDYLCMYFGSLQHLSNIFVKYGDVKVLYETFMVNKISRTDWGLQYRSDTELQICIERVFESMSESNENIRYILDITDLTTDKIFFPIIDINNHRIVKEISNYNRNLTKDKIEMLIKNACIDFLNNFILIPKAETQDDIYVIVRPVIEIPDTFVNMYIKRIFDNMIKSECVEACLKENINLKNKAFHATLSALFNAINKEEVENLIREASSDFMSQMLVISKECIKDESFWECERYGIVVPETFLPKYIERVFNDMTNPINVPKNRNNMNNKFRDSFHSYIRSISADELTSLIKTASSKFISHMCLSTEGEIHNIIAQRTACYFMFVPNKFLNIFRQHMFENKCSTSNYTSNFMEDVLSFLDNSPTITLQYYGSTESGTFLLLVSFQNDEIFDNLHQYPSKQLYYDFFTCKTIQFCVKSSKSIVEHYIQRMIKDWQDGKVHDVFGNINLSNTSFQCTFITYLMNIGAADQTVLAKTKDIVTGDSPLAVCCYVGILKLAKWCMEHNSNTNSVNNFDETPLYIACRHAHPVIVSCLLNHENKTDVNKRSGYNSETPLYEACKRGFKTIVLLLLKEDVDVNYLCNNKTPLYVACNYGHIEIVRILLAQNNIIDINKGYNTPLYIACKVGHKEIVSLLLNHTADEVDADVSKHTDEGETPLYAACQGGYTDIVKLLLAHDIRVINKSNIDGVSPLFIACQKGHIGVVSTLLKHKIIEIDQCILIGMSPLLIAALLGHTKIVIMLLDKKVDTSICVRNKENLKQVFKRLKTTPKSYSKFIKKLVREHATEHVKSYIDGKEEEWIFNSILGSSPLHMGCLMGHIEIVKLLVESNSNIHCLSENGSTPLFLACELGHEDIVHILLSNGANPTLDRKDGESPLTITRDNGHTQIVEILKAHTVESSAIKQSMLAKQ